MKRVVVAIDHSAVSRSLMDTAFRYAAGERDAALHFLHVIEPGKTAWHSFLGKVEETILAKVSEEVRNYVREAVASSGQVVPNWSVTVRPGVPCESILDFAEEVGAEMIMIGHRGISDLRRFVMGSVAAKVVAHANCSVYVHRPRVLAE
jgi:nucleotide-binding universal stress UspA family protein